MTLHWIHVTASWGLVGVVFAGFALHAAWRHRAARAQLAALDPRGSH